MPKQVIAAPIGMRRLFQVTSGINMRMSIILYFGAERSPWNVIYAKQIITVGQVCPGGPLCDGLSFGGFL
jgi:hypothetical protein